MREDIRLSNFALIANALNEIRFNWLQKANVFLSTK